VQIDAFRPSTVPLGRLVRLGVVLDTRNPIGRIREIARMCDRAGIDAVWVRDHLAAPDGEPRVEAWTALAMAGAETERAVVGAVLDPSFRPPATLGAMAGTLDAAMGGRLELGFTAGWWEREHRDFGLAFPDTGARSATMEGYVRVVRQLLSGEPVTTSEPVELREAELGVASPQPGGPRVSIEALAPSQISVAVRVADDVLVPARSARDVEGAVARIRAVCEQEGRDPATMGVAMEVPVSVGRTESEAEVRARDEVLFDTIGHPAEVGIFGTLEQCQARVVELAHAGVSDLLCVVPNNPDVQDVIAQLTAIAVGTVDVLAPGAPKSKPPDPPTTWGGRRRSD
jgi:alkanesulfonate monooxygenase SsuD/methylene tetrahydromethanopterin reductase-like flavin-dependent oxidoreductase (luciferase family)